MFFPLIHGKRHFAQTKGVVFVYDLQIIEQRIMSIAETMNLSKNKLLLNTNLNKSVFDNMKKGQIPSIDKIHIIADYLDCSVDYLLGRTDIPEVNRGYEASEEFYRDDLQLVAFGGDFKGKPKKKETQTT